MDLHGLTVRFTSIQHVAILPPMQDGVTASSVNGEATGGIQEPPAWLQALLDYLPEHELAAMALVLGGLVLFAILAHFVTRRILLVLLTRFAKRTRSGWDDIIIEHSVPARLVPIVPLIILNRGLIFTPGLGEEFREFLQRLIVATMVLVVVRALSAFLTAVNDIYRRYPISRGRPIKGYLQVVKIVAYIAAGIMIIAALIGQSPWFFLSGLGAMTAIIMLIFRDTILSLVAGIQLTSNDLIRVGDWIEMPQFHADGDVVDISLNVVKVQNWDKTITVIPAHKFLEHSFKNWRSMYEIGGRRIKRALHIDMNTIRFLKQEEITHFRRFIALKDYMEAKLEELGTYNKTQIEKDYADILANGRHMTNIGTLRAYIIGYLQRHPKIHKELTFLIRQLAPTPHGLPLEIYVFTNDTRWTEYEAIQADIFDHILAVLPDFGLRVYQEPAGSDLTGLADGLHNTAARRTPRAEPAATQPNSDAR